MKRRNTPAKSAILDVLRAANGALSQEFIEKEVKGTMDRVTVYRVLNSFCSDGYLHKILADDGKQYFAICVNCKETHHQHNHFHFRCLNCLKIECLKEEVDAKLPAGYQLKRVNCLLTGYCAACLLRDGA